MNSKLLNIVMLFVVISLAAALSSCSINNTPHKKSLTIEHIENRFFTLDFEKDSRGMSEVKKYFFTTFPHDDPTQGDVVYDRRKWVNENMIRLEKGEGLYLYIKNRNDNTGFDSVRITSKAYYNLNEHNQRILFVFKGKLPFARGLWPAWWLNGSKQDTWTYNQAGYIETDTNLDRYSGKGHFYDTPSAVNPTDWPSAGEIDIIETINGDNVIHNTLHTCPQMCDAEWNNNGHIINCSNAKPGDPNSGCSGNTYETIVPEGTFACLWERNAIKFYYWNSSENVRGKGGPLNKAPDPESWRAENLKNKVELLETNAECDRSMHGEWQCKSCDSSNSCLFKNLKMIFNISLCGIWAGDKFDNTENSRNNCHAYIFGEGKHIISNQFLRIDYIAVKEM